MASRSKGVPPPPPPKPKKKKSKSKLNGNALTIPSEVESQNFHLTGIVLVKSFVCAVQHWQCLNC